MDSYPIAHATALPSAPPVFQSSVQPLIPGKALGSSLTMIERSRVLAEHYSFAPGIADQFNKSCDTFGSRYWIVDNSGSMATSDGHVLISGHAGVAGMVSCSRWEELGASICWHAEMSSRLHVPTEFRLLNPPGAGAAQIITVGEGKLSEEVAAIQKCMGSGPTGRTPLCSQINQVVQKIRAQAPQLRAEGKKALLVLASDGASTDGDVASALRPLHDLPCWVVIRLCTDDDSVVNYWNEIDEELELDMDVLDDLCGEAAEVTAVNPWLVYGVNLHKLREFGTTTKCFDLLDERPFKPNEIKDLLQVIFGSAGTIQHPDLGLEGFEKSIEEAQKNCPEIYDPLRNRKRVGGCEKVKKVNRAGGRVCDHVTHDVF